MNFTININFPALEDLARAIHVYSSAIAFSKSGQPVELGEPPQPTSTQAPKEEKSKKQTKDESKTVKPEDVQPDADPVTETENATDESAGEEDQYIPTVVELRAKAQEKGDTAEGKKAIKALLDKFNSKSISNVPEKDRAAFLSALEAL